MFEIYDIKVWEKSFILHEFGIDSGWREYGCILDVFSDGNEYRTRVRRNMFVSAEIIARRFDALRNSYGIEVANYWEAIRG